MNFVCFECDHGLHWKCEERIGMYECACKKVGHKVTRLVENMPTQSEKRGDAT